ncbi:hypothetical protein KK062_27570 [Fulvivirgaceae bacterium PWU5]|uniref:Uncharacterized protein n=1 Tax=Dawidia cretensis TaxID=2782350 RepID=A0AAP2GSQ3_9BACT|nr:hypothetical protein [Dawidia cretensis]MBT1712031.1 hypothetical protein [Dawidia cretensis]
MKKAVFITGFNNWGKTTIINHVNLFNRSWYAWGQLQSIPGVNAHFVVENHSNDDYLGRLWLDRLKQRIWHVNNRPRNSAIDWDLFTALCPSIELTNNFIDLLNDPFFDDYEKHIFLIKYKWEHHAELIIKNILPLLPQIPNTFHYVIDHDALIIDPDDRTIAKTVEIKRILQTIFP